jgi:uncharacterized iron-regulated membrane protein
MLKIKNIKKWFFIHRWTSLICTLFLLELCITGLPLVFANEIDQWLNNQPYESLPSNTPMTNLDNLVRTSMNRFPGRIITSIFIDPDEPQIIVSMATSWKEAMNEHSDSTCWISYDARTAKIREIANPSNQHTSFIDTMLELHTSMFAGLPGELLLGFMGLLFVAALISGVVLYGPFMKKLNFGTIRNDRLSRFKWLDVHNLIGIVLFAWLLVVGLTGIMNELSTPLFALWETTDVKQILNSYEAKPVPLQSQMSSVQSAFDSVKDALPNKTITSIIYPGAPFASPYHYLLWTRGNEHLTSQLFNPVLVNAYSGKLTAVVKMPWYLRTLEVSRPLHFGDYGGLPLKIIWAIFDIAAIIVLISGLYLWFAKRKVKDAWLQKILENETVSESEVLENEY